MPYKTKERERTYQRERHQRFKKAGLCSCGRTPVKGYKLCALCAYQRALQSKRFFLKYKAEQLRRYRVRREKWIKEGDCARCGSPLMEDEDRFCFSCKAN